jgi:hypothetical protein
VLYQNGEPAGYSSVSASARWVEDEGDEAAQRILGRMREALMTPVLRPVDFYGREKDEGEPQ